MKFFKFLIASILILLFFRPQLVNAISVSFTMEPSPAFTNEKKIKFTFIDNFDNSFNRNQTYTFAAWIPGVDPNNQSKIQVALAPTVKDDRTLEMVLAEDGYSTAGTWNFKLWKGQINEADKQLLLSSSYDILSASARSSSPSPPCKEVIDPITNKKVRVCDTALGDISTDPTGFIKKVFGILLSLVGGIALLLIIVSGYRLMASQGNPEKVQEAREQLTSAIVGLLFIIFSFSILQIIGIDILRIPGFGR